MNSERNDEENMLVATVRAFIDRDVKPTVREVGTPIPTPRRGSSR
jgi:hypothetical protein